MAREHTAAYAVRRTRDHLLRCQRLCAEVEAERIDDHRLTALEENDNIFPALDYRHLHLKPLVWRGAFP
jgi:1,4-alpha-glucan branching enzyme